MYKEKKIEKIFYSTGDVAKIMKVNVSKVRFWEKEFNIINPNRNAAGKRKFTKQDIEKIKLIDQLLNEKKYTIKGAKRIIKLKKEKIKNEYQIIERLKKIKSFLQELQKNI
tara:strand:- start:833 stop:1165 length:333 start_codon:yes stop_codon:yes gene_type:complete